MNANTNRPAPIKGPSTVSSDRIDEDLWRYDDQHYRAPDTPTDFLKTL